MHTPRNLHRHTLRTKLYNKTDDFNCEPFIYMQQQSSSTCIWSMYLSVDTLLQSVGSYQDFLDIGLLLKTKLLNQRFLFVSLKSSLRKFTTGFVTRLTRWISLVEEELLTLPERLSSPQIFRGVRVTRSLVLCVSFVHISLSFCSFSFGHCVVCSSSIYEFGLPFWYLQTLLS